MLKKLLIVSSTFLALYAFAAEEKAPPPEAPYPGAQTEPEQQTLQPTKKALREAPLEIIEGNKFRGTRKIKHPDTKNGLYRITTKGEYLYKTEPQKSNHSVSLKMGPYRPTNLTSSDTGFSYSDIYSSSTGIIALFDYEWRLFSGFGKFGLKAGTGIFSATGNARFATPTASNPTGIAEERITLLMLPNTIASTLYLQFWDRQPLVPYGEAGLDGYVFNEYRDDGKPALGRFGGALGAHFSAGALLPLRFFDRLTMTRMSQEYGINDVYFAAEYRYVVRVAGKFDFSTSYVTGGVMVEF